MILKRIYSYLWVTVTVFRQYQVFETSVKNKRQKRFRRPWQYNESTYIIHCDWGVLSNKTLLSLCMLNWALIIYAHLHFDGTLYAWKNMMNKRILPMQPDRCKLIVIPARHMTIHDQSPVSLLKVPKDHNCVIMWSNIESRGHKLIVKDRERGRVRLKLIKRSHLWGKLWMPVRFFYGV